MSAYRHQMERQFSAQNLSSRGGSEVGSRHTMETGIYISSFAATVFISGLVTVGASLLSLLITLTVMLRSCQSQSAGNLEMFKLAGFFDYCKNFGLHAELNNLGADSFPSICRDAAVQYIKEGQYMVDLNNTVWIAEDFFSSIKPLNDGLDVVLMDADDLLPSEISRANPLLHWIKHGSCQDCSIDAKYLKTIVTLKLYKKLQAGGWRLILFTSKPEKQRHAVEGFLMSAGCGGWSALLMRVDNEMQLEPQELFSRKRTALQKDGFSIVSVISSQMDALKGPYLGKRIFKLPNPIINHNMDRKIESTI